MLNLYIPVAGQVDPIPMVPTNGVDNVSQQTLLLNILIDIRALYGLINDMQRGIVNDTGAQMRDAVVNATQLPLK